MNRQQIAVKLTLDKLGLDCSMKSFENRLILQKAVYLCQAAGVNLGYYYQWYLYGPYSPSLTRDAYTVAEAVGQEMDDSVGWKLDQSSTRRLKIVKILIPEDEKTEIKRQLELLASVHFLVNRQQVSGGNAKEITETLHRFKKDFREEEVKTALETLKENGLLAA
jgi:uncharacterized protein YwgA